MKIKEFDYIIIGGGLAGLQLALAFSDDSFFDKKKIAIIEPSEKKKNDKTWSFWEKGDGKWDSVVHHKWNKGIFKTIDKTLTLDLGDYQYKSVRAADFYHFAKKKLASSPNLFWIQDEIIEIKEKQCLGKQGNYGATLIFDSRISKSFFEDSKHIKIQQHFKGWVIETNKDIFDPSSFVMMDYSVSYKEMCFFTYVLPTSKRSALIEVTFFTPELVEESVYDDLLKKYITEQLEIDQYTVKEEEVGVIPMSSYPFHKANKRDYLKIGTAGGWVKASSGYSLKNTEKRVKQLINNIKQNNNLSRGLLNKRFQFYDRIFLRVLEKENHLGNELFESMYSKTSAKTIFQFLDEETHLLEELLIMNRFKKAPFLRSLMKEFG